jgi:hypothetical protein
VLSFVPALLRGMQALFRFIEHTRHAMVSKGIQDRKTRQPHETESLIERIVSKCTCCFGQQLNDAMDDAKDSRVDSSKSSVDHTLHRQDSQISRLEAKVRVYVRGSMHCLNDQSRGM